MSKRKRRDPTSFRLNDIAMGQLKELSKMMGIPMASVITIALRKLYQSEVHKTAVQQERRTNGGSDTSV